jgi:plasmid maintenance system antidote protein VapI
MAAKRFTDQIREAVDASGVTRAAICQAIDMPESSMSRFMAGKGGLSMRTLDRLAELIGLQATLPPKRRKGGR